MDLQRITTVGTAVAVVGTGTLIGGNYALDQATGGPDKRIKAKQTGYKRGFPDLFIYEPRGEFHGLAIELKVGYNKPTKEQLYWRNELNNRGYVAEICNGLDESLEVINRYLEGKISES